MKSLPRLFAIVFFPLFVLGVLFGCSGPATPSTKTLTSIAVAPASPPHLKVGATQQFTATGTYSDNSTADITSTVTWTSGTTATATISTAGLATGVAAGTTQITASQGGVTSPPVTLTVIVLSSIAVTPGAPSIVVGATQQFAARGTYSDSSFADITSTVTWVSGTPATATISAAGLATGVAQGTTQITASLSGVTSPGVTLTVISLTSIAITPNPASVAVAATVQFTATGTFSDASTANITTLVMWSSVPTSTATIGAATGLATGVANGTAQISAQLGSILAPSVTLTVGTGGTPVPIAVKIVQVNPTIAVGNVEDFTAKFLMSDATLVNPTAAVTWSSGTTATATIISTASNTGIASGVAPGTSTITAASTGLTSGTTLLTVVPAAGKFAFVAGWLAAASYATNAGASTLTSTGVVRDTTIPTQIIPTPSGQFAYGIGANGAGLLSLYQVDQKTGVLALSGIFNSGVSSLSPFQSIIDPTGRFLYIVNIGSPGSVAALATNTSSFDGSLTPITGSPFGTGNTPLGIAEDPAGKYVYVTNSGDGTISGFSVGSDGSLAPLSPTATFPTGSGAASGPFIPAIDPTGSFLYVPNSADGTISIFSIASDGSLTAVGSPVSTGAGSSPSMIAITLSNKFLYVTDAGHNTIVGFVIGAGGTLSGPTTDSPYSTGNFPQGLAIDVRGSSLAVVNQNDNTLTYYSIDSTTGKLTTGQTVETRSLPEFVNLSAGIAAPVIAPATAEAANTGSATLGTGSVSSYTVNPATGALTTAASSPITTLDGNDQVATSASGKFFYTASSSGKKLDAFSVDSTAALSGFTTNATDLGTAVPSGLYAELEDKYLYVADSVGADVITFNTSSSTGLTPNSTSSAIASINTIAGDAQGVFLVALGSNQLQSLLIDQATGAAGTGPATAQTGNWTAGAVDPSGRFLVAADSTGHQISTFAVTPIGLGNGGTDCVTPPFFADGCLTLVPSSTVAIGTGLNGPYAVTFDALGRFVFVADKATGNVAVFTFDSSTGLAAASGTPVLVSAQGITNVAVEANGKFLYVGTKGNGSTTAGTVAVYSIGATTGALTAIGTPVNAGIGTAALSVTNSVN